MNRHEDELAYSEAEYERLHRDDPPPRPDPEQEPSHPDTTPDEED